MCLCIHGCTIKIYNDIATVNCMIIIGTLNLNGSSHMFTVKKRNKRIKISIRSAIGKDNKSLNEKYHNMKIKHFNDR